MIGSVSSVGYANTQRYFGNTFNKTANINRSETNSAVDTVELSTKDKIKEKFNNLSATEKLALGIGATLVAGALVYAFRGKLNKLFKSFKQVEFKPSSTIEEAKKFAKQKLGVNYTVINKNIKYSKDDLDVMNFINEWLVETRNKMGKKFYPKTFIKDPTLQKIDGLFAFATDGKSTAMCFNTDGLKKEFEGLKKFIELRPEVYKINPQGKIKIINKDFDVPFIKSIVERLNNGTEKLPFREKLRLLLDLESSFTAFRENGKLTFRKQHIFQYLDHEQGHFLHRENLLKKIRLSELPKKAVEEFSNSKDMLYTARKVSQYALEHPDEFVADTFAMMKRGVKLDKDVIDLYEKFHGPKVEKVLYN